MVHRRICSENSYWLSQGLILMLMDEHEHNSAKILRVSHLTSCTICQRAQSA